MAEPHLLPSLLSKWQCRVSNQLQLPMFSHARLKSLKALLDGTWSTLVSAGNYLVSFLNSHQGEKQSWMAHSKKSGFHRSWLEWETRIRSTSQKLSCEKGWSFSYPLQFRSSKGFLKIQNCLFKLIIELSIARAKFCTANLKGPVESESHCHS